MPVLGIITVIHTANWSNNIHNIYLQKENMYVCIYIKYIHIHIYQEPQWDL